ncbi:hypothetical protein ETR_19608 [Erwinia tracheiphila PSU-1]|nr:hypothetical protein ETR_19608 [Erwinia tracheiphila PSU-1]
MRQLNEYAVNSPIPVPQDANNAALPRQPVLVTDIKEAIMVGKKRFHPRNFLFVFAQTGLHSDTGKGVF